jgi:F420H(2)-dependent quinone reductase
VQLEFGSVKVAWPRPGRAPGWCPIPPMRSNTPAKYAGAYPTPLRYGDDDASRWALVNVLQSHLNTNSCQIILAIDYDTHQLKVHMIFETLFKIVQRVQIFIFRRTQGKSMSSMRGMPILLLNTLGRKSGKSRTTPLMYFRDGENYVITASNLGRDQYPSWFYNLKNSSQVEIEVPGQRLVVSPSIASESEQARLWPQLVAQAPFFDEYRKGTTRPIPLVLLRPRES